MHVEAGLLMSLALARFLILSQEAVEVAGALARRKAGTFLDRDKLW